MQLYNIALLFTFAASAAAVSPNNNNAVETNMHSTSKPIYKTLVRRSCQKEGKECGQNNKHCCKGYVCDKAVMKCFT
eukprot:Pgem_evm1s7878